MFATIQAKLIIGVLILLIFAGAGGMYYYRGLEITRLTNENAVLASANKSLAKTVEDDKKLAKVNNDINIGLQTQVAGINTRLDAIDANVQKKVQVINNTYHSTNITTPKTPEEVIAKETQISTVYISALWEQYCVGSPTDQQCLPANPDVNQTDVKGDT